MIINIGFFTLIISIVLITSAIYFRNTSNEDVLGICYFIAFILLLASLICFCNSKTCNIDTTDLIKIKHDSSQIDQKVIELEQKYNDLLKMKFDEVK